MYVDVTTNALLQDEEYMECLQWTQSLKKSMQN